MHYQPRATKIHKSLMEVKTIGGVERNLFILNQTFMLTFVMGLQMMFYIPIGVILHFILVRATKKDPFLRLIYLRYNRQGDRYDPWPHAIQRHNSRPEGFGRGVLS